MPGGIFISYRREDAPSAAGRLCDFLLRHFPKDQVFFDVDRIDIGVDFVKVLNKHIAQCEVLLVIIGRNWLVRRADGKLRLAAPEDFVRIEIEAALVRDIPVVPVLVDGGEIPSSRVLPKALKSLATRQAIEINHATFQQDSDRLVQALRRHIERREADQGAGLSNARGPGDVSISGPPADESRPLVEQTQHAAQDAPDERAAAGDGLLDPPARSSDIFEEVFREASSRIETPDAGSSPANDANPPPSAGHHRTAEAARSGSLGNDADQVATRTSSVGAAEPAAGIAGIAHDEAVSRTSEPATATAQPEPSKADSTDTRPSFGRGAPSAGREPDARAEVASSGASNWLATAMYPLTGLALYVVGSILGINSYGLLGLLIVGGLLAILLRRRSASGERLPIFQIIVSGGLVLILSAWAVLSPLIYQSTSQTKGLTLFVPLAIAALMAFAIVAAARSERGEMLPRIICFAVVFGFYEVLSRNLYYAPTNLTYLGTIPAWALFSLMHLILYVVGIGLLLVLYARRRSQRPI